MALSETSATPDSPRLLEPVPAGRTYESLRHHYECERAIARRLGAADREGRKRIYATMYDELFAAVPDHPRLTRRGDSATTARSVKRKAGLLAPFQHPDRVLLEFGAGDCSFAFAMTTHFRTVLAVDIADQIAPASTRPDNFHLMIYDGYTLPLPDVSVDVAFSDQLIEHLHPDDTDDHFRTIYRLLRPGGIYLLRTPHRLTGPHDVSRYFCERAECFHLKEWTYSELAEALTAAGFSRIKAYWYGRGRLLRMPMAAFRAIEAIFAGSPLRVRRRLLPLLLPSIVIAAEK